MTTNATTEIETPLSLPPKSLDKWKDKLVPDSHENNISKKY